MGSALRRATPAAGSAGRWPSQRSMRNAVLARRALPDLEMLENDPGLAKILHRVETFGMKRSERRLLERRESPRSARCLLPRRYSTWQRFTRQLKRRCGEPGSTFILPGQRSFGLGEGQQLGSYTHARQLTLRLSTGHRPAQLLIEARRTLAVAGPRIYRGKLRKTPNVEDFHQ